jgi:hypothetical protein
MRLRSLATLGLAGAILAGSSGVALAQYVRPDRASDRNLWVVRAQIEREIDQLNRDDREYGGHRVAAIRDLQAARNELLQAEQYDRSHEYRHTE